MSAYQLNAAPTENDPAVRWPRRVALDVRVVLELADIEDYYAGEPDDRPATEGELRDKLAADFASFVLNEVANCKDYGAQVIAMNAEVDEVSA